MYSRVQALINRIAQEWATDERWQDLEDYEIPFPLHMENRFLLLEQADDLLDFLTRMRSLMAEAGIVRSIPNLAAVELPFGGHFRAWVRWNHISADGQSKGSSDYVYYLRDTGAALRVEMVHATHVTCSELQDWQPEFRHSA
jgi:hypothetical protein